MVQESYETSEEARGMVRDKRYKSRQQISSGFHKKFNPIVISSKTWTLPLDEGPMV